MKKHIILLLISFTCYSQQVLKRVTQTESATTVELFTVRNGSSSNNVVGNAYFTEIPSGEKNITFYNSSGNFAYQNTNGCCGVGFNNLPDELICNGTFRNIFWGAYTISDFCTDSSCSNKLDINIFYWYRHKDEVSDNNDRIDLLETRYVIPKLLNNGSPVPTGTWAVCKSLKGVDEVNGLVFESRDLCLRFDGTTWVIQNSLPTGASITTIPDRCNNLDTPETEYLANSISIYPNPANTFLSISFSDLNVEQFDYGILDVIGKSVANGSIRNFDKIKVEKLTSGIYFLKLTYKEKTIIKKFIKN